MKFNTKATVIVTGIMLAYSLCLADVGHAASDLDRDRGHQHHDHGDHSGHHHYSDHSHSEHKLTKEEIQQLRLQKLIDIATYFGIDPKGKSMEQLRSEVKSAKQANPEKWEAFKQQHQQDKLENLKKYAEEQGIDVEGKDMKQLKEELLKK